MSNRSAQQTKPSSSTGTQTKNRDAHDGSDSESTQSGSSGENSIPVAIMQRSRLLHLATEEAAGEELREETAAALNLSVYAVQNLEKGSQDVLEDKDTHRSRKKARHNQAPDSNDLSSVNGPSNTQLEPKSNPRSAPRGSGTESEVSPAVRTQANSARHSPDISAPVVRSMPILTRERHAPRLAFDRTRNTLRSESQTGNKESRWAVIADSTAAPEGSNTYTESQDIDMLFEDTPEPEEPPAPISAPVPSSHSNRILTTAAPLDDSLSEYEDSDMVNESSEEESNNLPSAMVGTSLEGSTEVGVVGAKPDIPVNDAVKQTSNPIAPEGLASQLLIKLSIPSSLFNPPIAPAQVAALRTSRDLQEGSQEVHIKISAMMDLESTGSLASYLAPIIHSLAQDNHSVVHTLRHVFELEFQPYLYRFDPLIRFSYIMPYDKEQDEGTTAISKSFASVIGSLTPLNSSEGTLEEKDDNMLVGMLAKVLQERESFILARLPPNHAHYERDPEMLYQALVLAPNAVSKVANALHIPRHPTASALSLCLVLVNIPAVERFGFEGL